MGCGASVEQHEDTASIQHDSVPSAKVPPTAILISMLSLENVFLKSFTGPYICITSRSLRRITKRFTKVEPDGSLMLPTDSVITFPLIGVDAKEIFQNTAISVTVFARDAQGKDRPVAACDFVLDPSWLQSADGFDGEITLLSELSSAKASPPAKIGFHISSSSMFPAIAPGLDEMASDFLIQQDETASALAEMTRKMRTDSSSQSALAENSLRRQSSVESPSSIRRQPSDSPSGATTRRQNSSDFSSSPHSNRRSSSFVLSSALPLTSMDFDGLLGKVRAEKNATSREAVLVSFASSSAASFTCAQLQQLLCTLRYDQEKTTAAKLFCSRIRDPSSADTFIELLAEADKADVRKRMGFG